MAGLPIPEAWQSLTEAEALAAEELEYQDHGEVFTRRWVVELILDLAGYTADKDLASTVVLEPACGHGAFVVPIVERLLDSVRAHGRSVEEAASAIAAGDLLVRNVEASRTAVRELLTKAGVSTKVARMLARGWIQERDFILRPPSDASADFVFGNPPYIRLEGIPKERSDAYRAACSTMGGRADIYVGFYEHGLQALRPGGTLGFICADRWMRNAYGARLRAMVSSGWSVDAIVSMTGVDAFEEEVDAYPAITILRRRPQEAGPLVVNALPSFDGDAAAELVDHEIRPEEGHIVRGSYQAARLPAWFSGQGGWPHGSPSELALIADLEARFPPLEDAATRTKVGIGVATGADKVFVVRDPDVVEHERLLALALPRDIASGRVEWSGRYLVNPWSAEGLVALDDWPRLAEYLGSYRDSLAKRHTAKSGRWHKTIDRVIEGLADRQKLYFPDFKEVIFPVLDEGTTYPHHNLYWVTSETWDLRVLGALLLSDVANLFISAYSVRMRGGYLRFQAQYLRRIRLPRQEDIDPATEKQLIGAFEARDRVTATALALRLYGLEALPS